MFHDPQFWVAFSFILLVVLGFKPVSRALNALLDARSLKIQKELNEALRLKDEAQELLTSYQKKHKDALLEAKHIIEHAENEAKRILREADANLESSLNNRIQASMQKIAAYENTVVTELRNKTVDIAMQAARLILEEKFTESLAKDLVITSVNNMKKHKV